MSDHPIDELARRRKPAPAAPASRIPSQHEYEQREAQEFHRHLTEVEKAPLTDRKEACANFLYAMQHNPDIIGERIGWLIDGNYGYGAMKAARRIAEAGGRTNKAAQLTHLVAAFEWKCPPRLAVAAWKKLTAEQ